MGKTLPQKERWKDIWMDVVIKTPPLQHTSSIYNRELGEGHKPLIVKVPHKKGEEGNDVVLPPKGSVLISEKCSNEEANPC